MAHDREGPLSGGVRGRLGAVRPAEVVRVLWGAGLLIRPRVVLARVHHGPVDSVTVFAARVLGARHLAQAAVTAYRPSPELVAAGVWSDAAHAVSMLGLAVVSGAHRRAGFTDAAVALAFAAAGSIDLRVPSAGGRPAPERGAAMARRVLSRLPGGPLLLHRVTAR